MISRILLPDHLVAHMFAEQRCDQCGKTERFIRVSLFHVCRLNSNLVINYRWQCECGAQGPFRIEMPFLFFGFLIASSVVQEAGRRRSPHTRMIRPRSTGVFQLYIDDFEKTLREWELGPWTPWTAEERERSAAEDNRPSRPSELDQLKFGMTAADWELFLKRLGLDGMMDGPPF